MGRSVGAIACHLVWETWRVGVPAMIAGTLSVLGFWAIRDPLLAVRGLG